MVGITPIEEVNKWRAGMYQTIARYIDGIYNCNTG